jgi:hypothetical protein
MDQPLQNPDEWGNNLSENSLSMNNAFEHSMHQESASALSMGSGISRNRGTHLSHHRQAARFSYVQTCGFPFSISSSNTCRFERND